MNYTTERICDVLPKLNSTWILPALQREFVWDAQRVCHFFDSLMRSYPISSLLLWAVPDKSRNDLEVYRFIDAASDAGRRNSRDRAFGASTITFVLDGQQRLTSLLVGLRGSYEIRKPRARSGQVNLLHLDLLRDGERPDDEGDLYYGFDFRTSSASMRQGSFWFEVGRIFRAPSQAELDELLAEVRQKLEAFRVKIAQVHMAEKNLRRLHSAIFVDEAICYHTEDQGDQERMLDIFVRANSGGKPLSKPDLLLSNLTTHWSTLSAREEVKNFVDEIQLVINRGSDRQKRALTQDFVLKASLVLLGEPIAYRISSFNKHTCERIAENWSHIKQAILETVEAANWFGVSGATLTSANSLIPIAYYLYQNPGVRLRGDSQQDAQNASLVRRWLIMALLNGIFGGSSDSMLSKARDAITAHGRNDRLFPVQELDKATREARRLPSDDENAIRNLLDFVYKGRATGLALTLLFDERAWGTTPHDVDHIFPQQLFKREMKNYKRESNLIGNLTLLASQENNEKKAKGFHDWVKTREPVFLKRHLIPADSQLWKPECFPEFLEARNQLILERLFEVLRTE